VERLGGTSVIPVDFRLIAATNQNLDQMVSEGKFRRDLFYRLNVVLLRIPSLKERRDDIIPLARHILGEMATGATGRQIEIGREAEEALTTYDWPGNGRELANVLERVASSLEGDAIDVHHLPFHLHGRHTDFSDPETVKLQRVRERAESEAIRYALAASRNNKACAAEMLGIHRTLLYKKMSKYKIPIQG